MSVFVAKNFSGMNEVLHPSLLDGDTAALLTDADIVSGKIAAAGTPRKTAVATPAMLGHHGAKNRSAVQWYGRNYWSINNAFSAPFYGGDQEGLGVPYPDPQITLAATAPESGESGLSGTFRYCGCFVNANGWEGAPGSLEEYYLEIELQNQIAVITAPAFPSGVASMKIYRTAAEGADFYFCGELGTSGGTLRDTVSELELVMLEPLSTQNNYPPPDKGKYLTEAGGVFFLAVGDRLYFSVAGNPHAWPTLNFIGFDSAIRGIAPEFQGVLVFTANNTFRVVGADNAETIAKSLIPGNQGCVNYRTIAHLSNAPVWVSNDGLCLWDGSSIRLVSRQVMKMEKLQTVCAVSANDAYYLFLAAGGIVYDLRTGGTFRRMSVTGVSYGWYDSITDRMFVQKPDGIYEFGTGPAGTFIYRSPLIRGNAETALKRYLELYIVCSEEVAVSVALDGKDIFSIDRVSPGRARIKFPFGTVGRGAQVTVSSSGELSELSVLFA